MARCPKCKTNWFWDWEFDTYRYVDGSEVESIQLNCTEQGMELDLIVFKCVCEEVNSAMYNDPRGSSLCNVKEWQDVDWELDGNAWGEHCKDCKELSCLKEE